MGSKTILLLGLLAMVLLIASEVSARELSQTFSDKESEKTNGVGDAKHQGSGYGGYPGGGYPGGGHNGGGHNGGGHNGGGGHCRYGCCGRSYYRGGCRCCTYAGEAVDAEPEAKPHN